MPSVLRWSIAALTLAAIACVVQPGVSFAGMRVQAANLSYVGTIDIPDTDGSCGSSPNARANGLAYHPSGNGGAGSFYIGHRRNGDCVAEISKPPVGGTAVFLQPYQPVLGNLGALDSSCTEGCYIGGLMVSGSKLLVTGYSYYDADGTQTASIWSRSLTLNSTTGRVGPVAAVAGGNQRMANGYMAPIPAALQSALGGVAAIGGCCWNVITGTSLGPALFGFDPAALGGGTPLLQYPDGHRTLNEWGAAGSHPEANPTTRIGGVAFIDGTDTVLFAGNTGKGEYCYGTGCTDPALPGVQGTHAYPYVHFVWAYDVDDLAAVKSGSVDPWDIFPYAMWELPATGDAEWGDEFSITGMAFVQPDKLYVLRSRKLDGSPVPQIHVYSITGLSAAIDLSGNAAATATVSGNLTIRLPAPASLRRVPR